MAQSESEVSDNAQIETFSDIEAELTALENQQPSKTPEFEIGNTVCAVSNPSVEGLILSKWETTNGKTEIIMLIPGYKKKGHALSFAAIIRKDAENLSKRRVRKYAFPLPNLEKWQACLKKHKKDLSWTTNAIQAFNAADNDYVIERDITSSFEGQSRKVIPAPSEENNVTQNELSIGVQQTDSAKKQPIAANDQEKFFEAIPLQDDSDYSDSDNRHSIKRHPTIKVPKKKRRNSKSKKAKSRKKSKRGSHKSSDTSDVDTSSSSNTEESSDDGSISSDISRCPFSRHDIRGNYHVKARIKGKSEERKSRALATGTKPLTFDFIWLEQHTIHLDTLMFENLRGVWKYWNEPIVDELALAFLELLVRVSLRREYSDRLDERVRRWMKKRRIGVSQRYGPVPAYLQQAKITEAGILANNNFLNRRWSASYSEKPPVNNNTYKPPFHQPNTLNKANGAQAAKSPIPTSV